MEKLCPKCGLDLSEIQIQEHRCPEPKTQEPAKPAPVLNTSKTLRQKKK